MKPKDKKRESFVDFLKKFADEEKISRTKDGRYFLLTASIANNVEKTRIMSSLTQKQLAKRLGTSQSYVSRIENEEIVPSIKTLFKIAEVTKHTLTPPNFVRPIPCHIVGDSFNSFGEIKFA